ncbi:hypothetical protein NMY22_g8040 [Coprinellus aureogranulatus]|nr:hypothetical protein NMY22_g8040 [Coprinellus aureogranulatus]
MITDALPFTLPTSLPTNISLDSVNAFLSPDNLKDIISNSDNNAVLCASTLAALLIGRLAYKRLTEISLKDVRGPEGKDGGNWLAGDIITLFTDTTGMLGARWAATYGTIVKLRAQVFTKNALLVADPAALRYIMQSEHADKFIRAPEWYAMADLLAGECIGSVEGAVHKRHRKGIRPAFGVPETRALLPVFNGVANKLCEKWDALIEADAKDAPVVNVAEWIGKAALDAFGEVALDYQFGGLDNAPTELARAMPTVLLETFGTPTGASSPLSPHCNTLDHVRNTNTVSQRILLGLIEDRKRMMKEGGGGRKDIMSHILRAGLSEDPTAKLTDYEIVSELRFLLLAGQETSANTLTWALNELVKAPQIQSELRQEIREAREKKGGKDFTAQDLQSLPLLNAVIKETLRFCPVVQNIFRQSSEDDVLPLSEPLKLKSGKTVTELPIPKGTKLYISLAGYNMLPWGRGSNTLGMYANLLTFSAGSKGCIGWRFAILQLQNLLAELVDRFEFSAGGGASKVVRGDELYVDEPMIVGEYEKGAQLPLVVKRAA